MSDTYRHTGSAIRVDFENTYEYRGHQFDKFDDLIDMLNFDLHTAEDIRNYDKDVEATLKYAVEIAKEFVNSTHPSNPGGKYQTTRRLAESIKCDKQTSNGGTGGRLFADAVDERGHKYAGHIEYGYTDRGGNPRGPWPFLRPAMRLAVSATKYNFQQTMANLICGEFNQGQMSIGSKNARQSVANLYGSTKEATKTIRENFTTEKGSRWNLAENGIGFKSGKTIDYYAGSWSWGEGLL